MIILPAIDLYEKKAVRLYKGDYAKMTVYSEDPAKLAQEFREAGAEWLHMVDLEGAKCGGTPNFDIAAKIIRTSGLAVELGGGIRDEETVLRYLDAGVNRVIPYDGGCYTFYTMMSASGRAAAAEEGLANTPVSDAPSVTPVSASAGLTAWGSGVSSITGTPSRMG